MMNYSKYILIITPITIYSGTHYVLERYIFDTLLETYEFIKIYLETHRIHMFEIQEEHFIVNKKDIQKSKLLIERILVIPNEWEINVKHMYLACSNHISNVEKYKNINANLYWIFKV